MRIVLTGAAGFVGANVASAWSREGWEVHAVVHPRSDTWRLDGVPAERVEADLEQPGTVAALLDRLRPDAIVNAAAHGAYPHQHDLDRMLAVNVRCVAQLVDWACRHDAALLHFGSSSEYGAKDHAPTERERTAPNSTYAITKAAATHLVCDAAERLGLRGVVLRLYSAYGPWEEPTRLMPTIARHAAAGVLPPTLVSPGTARDFVHIDDVTRAATSWIRNPVEPDEPAVLNIASGVQTTLGELIEMTRSLFDISDEPVWGTMARRRWDTACWVGDATRAHELLGWAPEVLLERGLHDLASFVVAHPHRYELARAQ